MMTGDTIHNDDGRPHYWRPLLLANRARGLGQATVEVSLDDMLLLERQVVDGQDARRYLLYLCDHFRGIRISPEGKREAMLDGFAYARPDDTDLIVMLERETKR